MVLGLGVLGLRFRDYALGLRAQGSGVRSRARDFAHCVGSGPVPVAQNASRLFAESLETTPE